MTIEFRCPNGHKLSCPDELAGRSAKCPKCGTMVRIPEAGSTIQSASDSGTAMPSVSDSNADHGEAEGNATEGAPATQVAGATAGSSQTIVFLCPNNHRLTAPAALQGKPGKCPHCGAKFLVPMLDQEEDEPEEAAASGSATGIENFMEDSGSAEEEPEEEHEDEPAGMHFDPEDLGFSDDEEQEDVDVAARDMARLFVQLWRQRNDQTEVELHLKGGQVFKPHWYAPSLSRRSYGMFATEDAKETYALTVIAWSAIERIALRGLDGLPQDIFEG